MKKGIVASILCLLVVAMMVSGFAKPTIAAEKEKVVVDFLGSTYGSFAFIAMYSASDIINKHHPTIKGLVHETFGASDCIKRLDADPKLRKHAFASGTVPALYGARAGVPKGIYPRPITGILNLWNEVGATYLLVTTDPKIKTPADLVGKRVDVGAYGNFMAITGEYLLEAYGVKDKVASLEHSAKYQTAFANLVDGKIDVTVIGMLKLGEKKCGFNAATRELMAARKVYPLETSKEMIAKTTKISKIPYAAWTLEEGVEELVYELMKVLIANADKFKNYSKIASWMTKENMAAMHIPVEDFHPGAIKAYREAGVKIGEEYFK